MNKNAVFHIIEDWSFWGKAQPSGIKREGYIDRLSALLDTNQIITITGPRRAGKSFIMRQMAQRMMETGTDPNEILITNLEDPRLADYSVESLENIFQAYITRFNPQRRPTLFLDEI